ncbi:hypothetical protein THRCLA_22593 [Thraustotheca clavata]|uniref:Uncharacterized protein n=1 Tax=Thraustotheca clavata TaxID=74557 RepID=A0A1V9YWQ5_9STRA|nr:hypothetical protein THRCLA_22593 [Thraustotheca clavata]
MQLYNWVAGTREVVSFEGDIRAIRLMSYQYAPLNVPAMDLEIGYNTSSFLFYLSTHTSIMLLIITLVVLGYAQWTKTKYGSINLLIFNRVSGPTWVGRSFLVIRGATALILLATAPVTLEKNRGLTNFQVDKRPWYYSMILAGELTWIIYIKIRQLWHRDLVALLLGLEFGFGM